MLSTKCRPNWMYFDAFKCHCVLLVYHSMNEADFLSWTSLLRFVFCYFKGSKSLYLLLMLWMTASALLFSSACPIFVSPPGQCYYVFVCASLYVIWSEHHYLCVSLGDRERLQTTRTAPVFIKWAPPNVPGQVIINKAKATRWCQRPWVSSSKNHNDKKQPLQPHDLIVCSCQKCCCQQSVCFCLFVSQPTF